MRNFLTPAHNENTNYYNETLTMLPSNACRQPPRPSSTPSTSLTNQSENLLSLDEQSPQKTDFLDERTTPTATSTTTTTQPPSLLSLAVGEAPTPILDMLQLKDALSLRSTSKLFLSDVTSHYWSDVTTSIRNIPSWRSTFPFAQAACFWRGIDDQGEDISNDDLKDSDFDHLGGLKWLCVRGCRQITSLAFARLSSLEYLDISLCDQASLCDSAFDNLPNLKTLVMDQCTQASISGRSFSRLRSLETLRASSCVQLLAASLSARFLGGGGGSSAAGYGAGWSARLMHVELEYCFALTDDTVRHLSGVKTLSLAGCTMVSDNAFKTLRGVTSLNVCFCCQLTDDFLDYLGGGGLLVNLNIAGCSQLTDRAFANLVGIKSLDMCGCKQRSITDIGFASLKGIQKLDMSLCDQRTITDAAFRNLLGIKDLNMNGCNQMTITDKAFENLRGIRTLHIDNCRQLTDAAFRENLRGVSYLSMRGLAVTDEAFESLGGRIHTLHIDNCKVITDKAFENLVGVHTLTMDHCMQDTITNSAFHFLAGVHTLSIACCSQKTINEVALLSLAGGIRVLRLEHCHQMILTSEVFSRLKGIETIHLRGCRKMVDEQTIKSLTGAKYAYT